MRKITNIFSILLLLLTFVVPLSASAQSDDQAKSFINEILAMEYNPEEIAHKSFMQIYGGFVFEDFGNAPDNPPTVLAKVLGYSNVIALLLGSVIMSYVIFAGAINTATSGQLLGKNWSSTWLPMRTAIGFGLIMPATDGQQVFSIAQRLVMTLIILGSNSGTWLWNKGVEEIAMGTPIISKTATYNSAITREIVSVLNCAVTRSNYYKEKNEVSEFNKGIGYVTYKSSPTNPEQSRINTPIKLSPNGDKFVFAPEGDKVEKIKFYDCGEIVYPTISGFAEYEKTGSKNDLAHPEWARKTTQEFQKKLDTAFMPYLTSAASLLHQIHKYGFTSEGIAAVLSEPEDRRGEAGNKMIQDLEAAAVLYRGLDAAYHEYYMSMMSILDGNGMNKDQWEKKMKTGGWMAAGAAFFDATRYQALNYNLINSISSAHVDNTDQPKLKCSNAWSWFSSGGSCEEALKEFRSKEDVLKQVEKFAKDLPKSEATNKTEKNDPDVHDEFNPAFFSNIQMSLSQVVLGALSSLGCDNTGSMNGSVGECGDMATNTSGLISPFTMLSAVGHGMIQISTVMWWAGLGGVTMAAGLEKGLSIVPGVSGIMAGIAAGIHYTIATMMVAAAGVVSMGFILAYMLPFLPVIAWIMIVIGYLINTIEAIAAAPLAVIMLVTPEGEGLSGGNFQKALQLINAIVLRPSLSIIGLFAAMTLAYTAFMIVNQLFWRVASLQDGIAVFGFLAIMTLYISLCYRVVQAMIGLMAKIPNEILEWMAGGLAREFGSNADESVQRTGDFSSLNSDGATHGFGAVKNAMANNRNKKGNQSGKPNDPDGGNGGNHPPSPVQHTL